MRPLVIQRAVPAPAAPDLFAVNTQTGKHHVCGGAAQEDKGKVNHKQLPRHRKNGGEATKAGAASGIPLCHLLLLLPAWSRLKARLASDPEGAGSALCRCPVSIFISSGVLWWNCYQLDRSLHLPAWPLAPLRSPCLPESSHTTGGERREVKILNASWTGRKCLCAA